MEDSKSANLETVTCQCKSKPQHKAHFDHESITPAAAPIHELVDEHAGRSHARFTCG